MHVTKQILRTFIFMCIISGIIMIQISNNEESKTYMENNGKIADTNHKIMLQPYMAFRKIILIMLFALLVLAIFLLYFLIEFDIIKNSVAAVMKRFRKLLSRTQTIPDVKFENTSSNSESD